jgi:16S rRNA (guanine(527)-N(7))-methyltransferase RsmG
VALLLRWNASINLIGKTGEDAIWTRHIADSWQLAKLIPPGCQNALDLGTGAGFPGLILSLATGIPFVLVESDRRKAAFLAEAIRVTSAYATVRCARIEACEDLRATLITARAFAPLPKLLTLALPHLRPGGSLLLPKGRNAEDELTQALAEWHMRAERFPSATAKDATIFRLSEFRPAPNPS